MASRLPTLRQAACGVLLAFVFWTAVFGFQAVNFWLGLGVAAAVLTGLSFYWAGFPLSRTELTLKNAALGLGSAALLYAVFGLCRYAAVHVLPLASAQIGSIYLIREEAPPAIIALVLIFVTSPCEEFFWRGFVQRWSMARYGNAKGLLVASLYYAGVHVSSGNLMLIGAALTAGLFWGWLYMRFQSLFACILSHIIWTVAIFILWPMQ